MVERTRTAVGPVTRAVGRRDVPAPVRALSSLPDSDYIDCFTLSTNLQASPEQWARALFGDAPDAAERFIWQRLLGLRLSRTAGPTTVAGWRIGDRGPNWIRLEARSWMVSGNLVLQTGSGAVSMATIVRYDKVPGRLVWSTLAVLHRRLAPGLLRDAATKVVNAAADQPSRSAPA